MKGGHRGTGMESVHCGTGVQGAYHGTGLEGARSCTSVEGAHTVTQVWRLEDSLLELVSSTLAVPEIQPKLSGSWQAPLRAEPAPKELIFKVLYNSMQN